MKNKIKEDYWEGKSKGQYKIVQRRVRRRIIPPICQNKVKMDKILKYQMGHHKSPREKHRQENFRYSMQQYFHQYNPQGKEYKGKNKQMGLYQTKKLLYG